MEAIAKKLVIGKKAIEESIDHYTFDDILSQTWKKLTGIAPKKYEGYYPAINPAEFIRHVVPFSDAYYSWENMVFEEIDPWLVLGGTYNNYSNDRDNDKFVLKKLNDFTEQYIKHGSRHHELSRFCRIGDFPIYVALEGKNRIQIFQQYGVKIKAMVTRLNYPKATDLQITRVKPFGHYYITCNDPMFTISNRTPETRIIPFAGLAIPLFKKYGVLICNEGIDFHSFRRWRTSRYTVTSWQMLP